MKQKLICAACIALAVCSVAGAKSKKKAKKEAEATQVTAVAQEAIAPRSLKRKVAISRFTNESKYAKGAFYDGANDPVGRQAVDMLSRKLTESGKFILLNRLDAKALDAELENYGNVSERNRIAADYLLIGSVTKYGRKETGSRQPFKKTKVQRVEVGVGLTLVDVRTGQSIYGEEAEGSAETESTTVMGYGGSAGYDETLTDSALDVALSQLVENVINKCMDRPWQSSILSYDDDACYISGGDSQGIREGDTFAVMKRGKQVKNPTTGMMIEVPGRQIGTVTVLAIISQPNPVDEMCIVDVSADLPMGLDSDSYDRDYIIQEITK